MRKKGQIEDTISKAVSQFYAENIGHGPKETKVYILADMVIVRLKGELVPLEKKLLEHSGGVAIVKNIREQLHENFTKNLSKIVNQLTGCTVISAHSDISTKTGEMFEVFILDSNYETTVQIG